ncbi:hypothetical protein [Micromonospora haikouensis]|uniref:hypothetical protein n=1 Tax=Micromonospora haikouensis TaxID=686309 RepID=UPI003D74D928
MKLLTRSPRLTPADLAELRRIELTTQIEHARQADQLRREQDAADRAEQRRAEREREREERRRRKAKAKARARRLRQLRRWAATARTVGPLLVVNAATVGGQLAYAYDQTPADWHPVARGAVAVGVAVAAESVALYVGWHAHDALLQAAHTTATRLRRASYAIALVMAGVNYSHFAGEHLAPTALAVILGVLSSLSPWLWGLHTRRMQQVQLLRKSLVDETGAVFDPARRRAFPIRSWLARRWSIDNNVREPRAAWDGYKAHRAAQLAAAPGGRIRAAWRALLGTEPAPAQSEPVSLDDPEIRLAAQLREQMAAATDRIRAGAARVALADRDPVAFAARSAGGIWDMVEATDEPAHVRRPAPPRVASVPAEPTGPAAEPEPTPAMSREPEPPAPEPSPIGSEPTPREPGYRVDVRRLAEAYDEFVRTHRRKPKGEELGAAAGCSKATANRWMRDHRAQRPTQ